METKRKKSRKKEDIKGDVWQESILLKKKDKKK